MGQIFWSTNILLLTSILVMLFMAVVLSRHKINNNSSKFFVLIIFSALLWVFANLLANLSLLWSENALLFWTRMTIIGPIFLPFFFYIFSKTFLNTKLFKWDSVSISLFVIMLSILPFVLTRYNVSSVHVIDAKSFNSEFSPGVMYVFFIIYAFIGFVLSIYNLILRYRLASEIERLQIKTVIYGLLISTLIALISSAIMPLLGYSQLINIAPVSVIFFIGFTTYAIVSQRLFGIRVILTQVAVGLVVFALLVQTLFSGSLARGILNGFLLCLVTYGGYILIKSVIEEIQRREQIAKLADQLKVANIHLQELDKMKTEFVTLASHELLTPISAIEGYLSMMLDEKIVNPKSDKGVEYMGRVYSSSKRLAKLVTNLLNVSRIEEGRLLIQNQVLDINKIIDYVVGELKFKAQEKNIKLIWQPGEWPQVYADEDKLKEILVNLVGNAIKYSQKGEISIAVEALPTTEIKKIDARESLAATDVELHAEMLRHQTQSARRILVGEKQLTVHVKDQGIGIAPDEITHLFRKFHRIGDVTTQQTQGTGLGLYISKSLIEMMHGRMWANSPGKGKGTTFSFSLPLSVYEPQIKLAEKDIKASENAKPLAHSSADLTSTSNPSKLK